MKNILFKKLPHCILTRNDKCYGNFLFLREKNKHEEISFFL